MKVKIFSNSNREELEKEINNFIEEIEKNHMEVKDIKYSTGEIDYVIGKSMMDNVLILYGPDGKLYLNLGTSLSEAEYNVEFGR